MASLRRNSNLAGNHGEVAGRFERINGNPELRPRRLASDSRRQHGPRTQRSGSDLQRGPDRTSGKLVEQSQQVIAQEDPTDWAKQPDARLRVVGTALTRTGDWRLAQDQADTDAQQRRPESGEDWMSNWPAASLD